MMEEDKMREDILSILSKIKIENDKEILFQLCYELKLLYKSNAKLFRKLLIEIDTGKVLAKSYLYIFNEEWKEWVYKKERLDKMGY